MLKALVTDIEGTTSSIRFVKEVLFPYSIDAIPAFIERHGSEPKIKSLLDAAADEAGVDKTRVDLIIRHLLDWVREDRKVTALKAIQGSVWEQGYRNEDYKAHVYEDAYETLKSWHKIGLPIYIYSSGSVQAQKLFFAYSEFGDLTSLFEGYFDTNVGPKKSPLSYKAIAEQLALAPEAILFLSDVREELDAAKQTGMQTYWLVRPDDTAAMPNEILNSKHPTATSFYDIVID